MSRVNPGVFLCAALMATAPVRAQPPGQNSNYQAQLAQQAAAHPILPIGAPVPDFNLKGADGKMHTLAEYKSSPVLAVVFICNHCPASQLYESRILRIAADYAGKGVQVIAIQPNGPQAMSPRELNFTDLDDSYESMVIHAKYRNFTFPYLFMMATRRP